jgi:serine protease AprX
LEVIIQFRAADRKGSRDRAFSRARVKEDLSLINAAVASVSARDLEALANDPDIAYITPNREISATMDRARKATLADTAINAFGASGEGIRVAVIDSGINRTEAFNWTDDDAQSRVIFSQSFVKNQTSTSDEYGHGTHVASIIAGDGAGQSGSGTGAHRGVSWDVDLINLRVLDKNGKSDDAAVIAALQWAVSNRKKYQIRVINLSLGRPVFETYKKDPLCLAAEAAWKAGIVVVAAAGNDGRWNDKGTQGYGTINAPGNDPYVITVGATNMKNTDTRADDMAASYSSKGPSVIDYAQAGSRRAGQPHRGPRRGRTEAQVPRQRC